MWYWGPLGCVVFKKWNFFPITWTQCHFCWSRFQHCNPGISLKWYSLVYSRSLRLLDRRNSSLKPIFLLKTIRELTNGEILTRNKCSGKGCWSWFPVWHWCYIGSSQTAYHVFLIMAKPQLTYVVSISIFDYTWNRPHICFIFTLHVFQLKYKITHITFSITIVCTCYASLATFSDKSVFKSINFVNFHEKVVKFQYRIGHCRADD